MFFINRIHPPSAAVLAASWAKFAQMAQVDLDDKVFQANMAREMSLWSEDTAVITQLFCKMVDQHDPTSRPLQKELTADIMNLFDRLQCVTPFNALLVGAICWMHPEPGLAIHFSVLASSKNDLSPAMQQILFNLTKDRLDGEVRDYCMECQARVAAGREGKKTPANTPRQPKKTLANTPRQPTRPGHEAGCLCDTCLADVADNLVDLTVDSDKNVDDDADVEMAQGQDNPVKIEGEEIVEGVPWEEMTPYERARQARIGTAEIKRLFTMA